MNIVNVGYNYIHPDGFYINRPHGSNDWLLIVVKSPAFFILHDERQYAAPNSCIIFSHGTPQIYGAENGIFINDWIHFEPEKDDVQNISNLGITLNTILPLIDTTVLSGFIKSIFYEKYSQNTFKDRSSELYFNLILFKLSELINLPDHLKENRYYSIFSSLRNEIYRSPERFISVTEISKQLNLSRSYVQHLYKSFFGKSIISDLTDSRIEHAKYLLASTELTISAISEMCGYKNDVHFMRTFKRSVSLTPSAFRKKFHIAESELESSMKLNPFIL